MARSDKPDLLQLRLTFDPEEKFFEKGIDIADNILYNSE